MGMTHQGVGDADGLADGLAIGLGLGDAVGIIPIVVLAFITAVAFQLNFNFYLVPDILIFIV